MKEQENPYLNARKKHNEYEGGLIASRHMWQIFGVLGLITGLAGIGGVIHIGSQSKYKRAGEAKDPQPTPSQRKHQNDLVRKLNNAGQGRASRPPHHQLPYSPYHYAGPYGHARRARPAQRHFRAVCFTEFL